MRLVHRDISPSNVFIARRGDVKLGDFGIAHAQKRESKTQAGTLKGKYGYMSPEQVVGNALDARSDLFAVGIVLAEMLMGRRLFTAPNDLDVLLMVRDGRLERLDKYAKDLPPELDTLLRKALAKRVERSLPERGRVPRRPGRPAVPLGHAGLALRTWAGWPPTCWTRARTPPAAWPSSCAAGRWTAAPAAGDSSGSFPSGRTPAPSNVGSGPGRPPSMAMPAPGGSHAPAPARPRMRRGRWAGSGPPASAARAPTAPCRWASTCPRNRWTSRWRTPICRAPPAAPTWTPTWRRWTTSCPSRCRSWISTSTSSRRAATGAGRRRTAPPIWAR